MKFAVVLAALILAAGAVGTAYVATRPAPQRAKHRVCVEYETTGDYFPQRVCKRYEYK
jgi:hypothetical protein